MFLQYVTQEQNGDVITVSCGPTSQISASAT